MFRSIETAAKPVKMCAHLADVTLELADVVLSRQNVTNIALQFKGAEYSLIVAKSSVSSIHNA